MAENKADDLALLAYLYTGGELNEADQAAFERRLAQEQPAREALVESVRMSASLMGGDSRPDPAYRQRVRDRLQPAGWRRPWGRHHYRGHPLLWTGLGAVAAVLVSLTLLRPEPEVKVVETSRPAAPQKQEPVTADPEPVDDAAALQDMALIWAELHTPDNAVKAATQEQRRKSRIEDRRQTRKSGQPPPASD